MYKNTEVTVGTRFLMKSVFLNTYIYSVDCGGGGGW